MRRIRVALLPVLVAMLLTSAVVSAATFGLGSTHLAAGGDAVQACDPDGFVIDGLTLNGSQQITAITISDIAAACINGTLTVDLTRADNVSIGTGGPVTVTTSPLTVPIAGTPAASLVQHEVIIIVGP